MCRLMSFVSRETLDFPQIVGANFDEFVELSTFHKHGWGIAINNRDSTEVAIRKSPEMARANSDFEEAAHSLSGDGGLLHLRWATTGLAACPENTHPFTYQGFSFIHNGEIKERTTIDPYIETSLFQAREGDTDSERYFFLLLTQIKELGLVKGARKALEIIEQHSVYSSLNAMLLDSENLLVISKFDPTRIPSGQPDDYYQLSYRKNDSQILIASSGWPQPGWQEIPNNSIMLINRASQDMTITSLDSPL